MTDFTIAGGSVEYRHTKPGTQYESTVPAVTLHFTVENGSDPEAVTAKVMAMAMRSVESALSGNLPRAIAVSELPLPKTARKQKQAEPDYVPETVEPPTADVNPLAEMVADTSPTASVPEPSVEDELAALAGEAEPATKTLTEKDVEAALMSASSHLRKEGISVTVELGKLLAAIGCPGWKQLKPEQYGAFIDKLKGLHSLKKA